MIHRLSNPPRQRSPLVLAWTVAATIRQARGLAESGSRRQHPRRSTAGACMTSISSSLASPVAEIRSGAEAAKARNFALDRTRTFLTLVVLIHHAVIPYTHFGHTDPKSWIGFDASFSPPTASSWRCSSFCPACLSGRALATRRRRSFCAIACSGSDCRLRSPPSPSSRSRITPSRCDTIPRSAFRSSGGKRSLLAPGPAARSGSSGCCWRSTLRQACCIGSRLGWSTRSTGCRCAPTSSRPVLPVSAGVTASVYIPARVYFGPSHWFEFGPLSVQASRVLLYAAYFFIGAGIGAANFDRGLLGADGRLAKAAGAGLSPRSFRTA